MSAVGRQHDKRAVLRGYTAPNSEHETEAGLLNYRAMLRYL